jgi:medium-chain acyl-[acyl-carrier-protein] hydrolase
MKTNAWVRIPAPSPAASVRLFCLPFAGGGASAYRPWCAQLKESIEVCLIQPPGREDRHREPAYTQCGPLADAIFAQIRPYLDKPYAFYGHSLGALLAFEVARRLHAAALPAPSVLFVAAHRAPHLPLMRRVFYHLPEHELIAEIQRLNGTPAAILEDRDMMSYWLPIMRADLQICDTYEFAAAPPLSCAVVACAGSDDTAVPPERMQGWQEHTTGAFALQVFPGDHFFVRSSQDALLEALERHIGVRMFR